MGGSNDKRKNSRFMEFMVIVYKQTTPAKQRMIMLEDLVQTVAATALSFYDYAHCQKFSTFVVIANVLLPLCQLAFSFALESPMRKNVEPWMQTGVMQALE